MRALILLILFAGQSALACPSLEGSYTCYAGGHEIDLRITSYDDDGLKTVYFGSVPHIIDGGWYEYEDSVWPDIVITQRKSECIGDTVLKSEENSAVYRDGVKIQEAFRDLEVSQKSLGDLLVRSVTQFGGKKRTKTEYGCTRNSI